MNIVIHDNINRSMNISTISFRAAFFEAGKIRANLFAHNLFAELILGSGWENVPSRASRPELGKNENVQAAQKNFEAQ